MPKKNTEDIPPVAGPAEKPKRKRTTKPGVAAADRVAGEGDRVTVEYIGTLPNGRIFDKAEPANPFTFTIGAGEVLPAFEHQVKGMKVGERMSTFTISPLEAYGSWKEDLVITVDRSTFPDGDCIEVGKKAKVAFSGGAEQVMKVIEITENEVKLDANHPLAGYNLTYHSLTLSGIE